MHLQAVIICRNSIACALTLVIQPYGNENVPICDSCDVQRADPRYQTLHARCTQAGKGPSTVVHTSWPGPLRRSVQRSYRLCGVYPKQASCATFTSLTSTAVAAGPLPTPELDSPACGSNSQYAQQNSPPRTHPRNPAMAGHLRSHM